VGPSHSYAAWFNTEEHKVTPLVGGYRAVLTYNLSIAEDQTLPAAATTTPIGPKGSSLSELPRETFGAVVGFCSVQDQLNLNITCPSFHRFFQGKSFEVAFLAEQLELRKERILHWLLYGNLGEPGQRYGGNTTMDLFLKHEYCTHLTASGISTPITCAGAMLCCCRRYSKPSQKRCVPPAKPFCTTNDNGLIRKMQVK